MKKILWIPHNTWEKMDRQRDQYFIDVLKDFYEIHVLIWSEPKSNKIVSIINIIDQLKSLNYWIKKNDGVMIYHYPRFFLSRFTIIRKINQILFRFIIKKIVRQNGIDAMIVAPSEYLNGFPPFDMGIPMVFDYLDWIPDKKIEKHYINKAAAVMCVSKKLFDDVVKINPKCHYVPNGVDMDKFSNVDNLDIRTKYAIDNNILIGLIGLTFDGTYFIDAFRLVLKRFPTSKLMIVGGGDKMREIIKASVDLRDSVIITGRVDYQLIHKYFASIDVGLYPVKQNEYYDSASPIKIFEYSAMKIPIVSSDIEEVRNLNFPNIILAGNDPYEFADGIITALTGEFDYPDLHEYDWKVLSENVKNIINLVCESKNV